MFSKLRTRLTYANVVATLALFLALTGGTAVALTGSNTVFSDDITNNEVRSADVRNDNLSGGGLTSRDVRSNALGGGDINELSLGQVPSAANAGNAGTASSIADNSVTSPKVANGSLDAADTFKVDTLKTIDIASVPANSCLTDVTIPGVTGFDRTDLALLWPSSLFTGTGLTFTHDRGDSGDPDEVIQLDVCNPRPTAVDPPQSGWKILVIDQ